MITDQGLRTGVLVCTHDGCRFIREQLDSILQQTDAVDEVWIFDWGSRDGTAAVIDEWVAVARARVRVEFVRRSNAPGAARSFLAAMEEVAGASSCDLIFLADQDDVWKPDKVGQTITAYCGRHGQFDLAFSDCDVLGRDGVLIPSFYSAGSPYVRPGAPLDRSVMLTNHVVGMTICVRREWLASIVPAFSSEWVMHDWALVILAWLTRARVHFLPVPLVTYRQHSANELGAAVTRSPWSKARVARAHARRVRGQLRGIRAACEAVAGDEGRCAEALALRGRLPAALVVLCCARLRPSYRLLLSATFLLL